MKYSKDKQLTLAEMTAIHRDSNDLLVNNYSKEPKYLDIILATDLNSVSGYSAIFKANKKEPQATLTGYSKDTAEEAFMNLIQKLKLNNQFISECIRNAASLGIKETKSEDLF